MKMEEDAEDEQTPDFEDLLAAYNLSETAAVSSTGSNSASGVNIGASCSDGTGSLTTLVRPPASAMSSLSILKEMARMEPPITDGNIRIQTASSEVVVKENGVVDFRKPYSRKFVSGGKPANMQRMLLNMSQLDRANKAKTNARKTTSCRSLLTSTLSLLKSNASSSKAKKSVMHLGPRSSAFSGKMNSNLVGVVSPTNVAIQSTTLFTHIPTSSVVPSIEDEDIENGMDMDENVDEQSPAADDPIEEESSDQLYTCVLPPYVPKVATSDGPLAEITSGFLQRGYPCLDCADRFLMESSLTSHLKRHSLHITLNCDTCKQELIFYNRCSLLSHVRMHGERNQPSDFSNILVRPLKSSEFVDETGEPSLSTLTGGHNHPLISTKMTGNTHKYQCHECQQYCGSSLSLQEHFGYSKSRAINTFNCNRCHSLCPTKCSLSAHCRLHERRKPFLCPECGTIVTDSWEVFQRHLSTVCLHSSRTVGLKCPTPACDALYITPNELRDHVADTHGDSLHKCEGCPMAFRNLDSFELHRLEKHSNALGGPEIPVKCRTVSKCPLCDVVFQNVDAFRSHLSTHSTIIERDLRFMYKCNVCKLLFEDKPTLLRHLKRNHPSVFKMRCKICRSAFRDLDLLMDHMRRKHPEQADALKEIEAQNESRQQTQEVESDAINNTTIGGLDTSDVISDNGSEMMILDGSTNANNSIDDDYVDPQPSKNKVECIQCRRSFHSTLGLKMHLLRSHSADDKRAWCAVCSEYLPDPKEMAQHGHTVHLDAGQLVCTLCSNAVFATKFGLAKHIDQQHVDGSMYPLQCIYCDRKLFDPKAAANHWKSEHRLFSFSCDQCDAQYLEETSFLRHKRCAHAVGDATKKYYRCSLCEDVDFAKRANLVHHLELKHGIPKMDIDLTQLVSTQCSPPVKLLETRSPIVTPTPPQSTSSLLPPMSPPVAPASNDHLPSTKKKKKRKRKKEGKRDRKKRRNRGSSSSRSKKSSSPSDSHRKSTLAAEKKNSSSPRMSASKLPEVLKVDLKIAAAALRLVNQEKRERKEQHKEEAINKNNEGKVLKMTPLKRSADKVVPADKKKHNAKIAVKSEDGKNSEGKCIKIEDVKIPEVKVVTLKKPEKMDNEKNAKLDVGNDEMCTKNVEASANKIPAAKSSPAKKKNTEIKVEKTDLGEEKAKEEIKKTLEAKLAKISSVKMVTAPDNNAKKTEEQLGKEENKGKKNEVNQVENEDAKNEIAERTSPPPTKKLKVMDKVAQPTEATAAESVESSEPVEHHLCAKCKYEANRRSEFVEHIRTHKKVGDNNYQCLECGICFVVEPSLRKHLVYAHKVKDVDKFMVDKSYPTYVTSCNGTVGSGILGFELSPDKDRLRGQSPSIVCSPSGEQLQQSPQQLRIFQCDVCRNTFETELSLRTHMRTHGMAFLKIKRISNFAASEINKNAASSSSSSSPQKVVDTANSNKKAI